ncbi:MAG: zinc-ribbon domain-containing protein, partial [Oscillospiraceae bacterium]|nr:zinc-ribbon domain-containing protein [Oscillospiraceae bacterium]
LDECYAKLDEIGEKIDEYKNEVSCPECGVKSKRDNNYCPNCGAKLPERPVEPEETEEAADASEVETEAEIAEDKGEE